MITAFTKHKGKLKAKGCKPKMNVMDNQATKNIKKMYFKGLQLAGRQTAQPPG